MTLDEEHPQSGQRLATPATRRARRVRAVFDVHRQPKQVAHPREHLGDVGHTSSSLADVRLPRQPEEAITPPLIAAQDLGVPRVDSGELGIYLGIYLESFRSP